MARGAPTPVLVALAFLAGLAPADAPGTLQALLLSRFREEDAPARWRRPGCRAPWCSPRRPRWSVCSRSGWRPAPPRAAEPPPREAGPRATGDVGGWLLIPAPVETPCRVVSAELRADAAHAPYARVLPAVGHRIPKAGGYEHVGARVRFRGSATAEVAEIIRATASGVRLECVPDAAA